MAKSRLSEKALYVERGYGQVEPNHLSAQRTGQIYAQLPAKAGIEVLENGQYVKYNYKDGVVDFEGAGEWMLVFNEVKLYRDHLDYNDFAMIASNYVARVYSPVGELRGLAKARNYQDVVTPADPYEVDSTATPFAAQYDYSGPKMMVDSSTGVLAMVPRVFKTNVGDIYTTNCLVASTTTINAVTSVVTPTIGQTFTPGSDGYLAETSSTAVDMLWQVVKVYDLGDRQPAVKLMRIQ